MIDIESIGSRVKYHRLRNKISQEELADLAQVSRVHISYLERGERIPSMESFINIANALNVSADELLANNLLVTGHNMNANELDILFDCSANERQIEKNANYTTMSNYHLRDSTISFKAKGILSMFLSLPKDWSYSVSGLAAISKEGKDGILSGLKELEAAGYLERHRYRNEQGRLGDSEYVIYEIPRHVRPVPSTPEQDFPKQEKPVLEKPFLDYPDQARPAQGIPVREKPTQDMPVQEKPAEEKPSQRNTEQERTDRKRTDEQIEREDGLPRHRYGLYRNVLLSDAEFQSLKEQFPGDYAARINRLSEYMASCGKTYKNHLATIRSWARKDAQRNIDYHHGMYTYDGNDSL